MRTFAQKQNASHKAKSTTTAKPSRAFSGQCSEVRSILHLQRTIGNQAVQRLLQANSEELEACSASTTPARFAHDLSLIPLYAKAPAKSQLQLKVSAPGDRYEQEADKVAEQVMRMRDPAGSGHQDADRHTTSSRYGSANKSSSDAKALNPELRQFFEPRFGHNFSGVRVHTNHAANESASHVRARAYTIGNDITFATGEYRPMTVEGKRLLAMSLLM